jgi:hypothetical protein
MQRPETDPTKVLAVEVEFVHALFRIQGRSTQVSPNPKASSHHLDDADRTIMVACEEKPFSEVRDFARATHIPHALSFIKD